MSRDLAAEIRAAVGTDLKDTMRRAVTRATAKRRAAIERFPGYEEARDRARHIKEQAIAELPQLVERFSAVVADRGGHVHFAEDGEQACRIITDITRSVGAQRVTKSKSMTSEEIHLNSALEGAGVHVRETDLGEYIVQLANDRPSHIIAPILHMSVDDVREVFRREFKLDEVPEDPEELTQIAREKLRADFLAADLGITGANFLLADTGTVVIVENEGNARLTTQVPPTHVALAGVEKLLPTAADLLPFLQLLPRTGTGQLLTSYLSFISGPGWGGSPLRSEAREFHVVLLDNGRYRMRDDEVLSEALLCIRCGGCMMVCPPYQVVGGHTFGGPTYPSGIGTAWEAGVRGLDVAAEFNELCTTCSRCQDVCPVRIDIPWMNTVIRERIAEQDKTPRGTVERVVYDRLLPTDEEGSVSLSKRLFSEPARIYELSKKRPWNTLMSLAPVRAAVSRAAGLAPARPLPQPQPEPLSEWFRKRGGRVASTMIEAKRMSNDRRGTTVFLFADCHTEHVDTEVGKAAVSCMEKCGLAVAMIAGQCCGRAALSQGMMRTARRQATSLQQMLTPLVDTGHDVVGIEPSCLSAIVDDHTKLLSGEAPGRVAAGCHEILAYLDARIAAEEATPRWNTDAANEPMLLHGHCQQKTLGWMPAAERLLRRIPGGSLQTTSSECCGMAGSFGYKSDFYPVSEELGRRLADELDDLAAEASPAQKGGPEGCRYLACGTSCRSQIADLAGHSVVHPLQWIDERLDNP